MQLMDLLYHECVIIQMMYHISIAYNNFYSVGDDYTTFTGNDTITVVLAEGSHSACVDILIHHDTRSEGEESFTAELQSDSQNTSATVVIRDVFTVLCQFDKSAYNVYESVGNVTLTVNCSSTSGKSTYILKADTIYGIGNATCELIYTHFMMDRHTHYHHTHDMELTV